VAAAGHGSVCVLYGVAHSCITIARNTVAWVQALKRKKMYEQQRETTLRTAFNVEQVWLCVCVHAVVEHGNRRCNRVFARSCTNPRVCVRVACVAVHVWVQTAFAVSSIKDTFSTVQAMKTAAVTLKQEHAKLDIGEIEDMQDDLADLMMDADEINELMGRSYGWVCRCVVVCVLRSRVMPWLR
jgi:hypothetical protein